MNQLYPTPKTQAERDADDARRAERYRRQLPKLPWATIPLLGAGTLYLLIEFIRITPEMWADGSSAFIFFTFFMWLVVAGGMVVWARYTYKVLYAHNLSSVIFWPCWALILGAVMTLRFTGTVSFPIALLSSIGAVVVYAFLLAILVVGLFVLRKLPSVK